MICGRCGAPTLWPVERCRECAGRRLAFRRARAAVAYSGAARDLLAAWKEHGLRRAAIVAAELVVEQLEAPAADVITYIPPDPARLLVRGHHPAERLARELAGRWCLPSGGPARPRRCSAVGAANRPAEGRAPPERARRLRRGRCGAPARAARRRRVHDGCDRLGGGDRAQARRRPTRRRGHVRPHGASLVGPRAAGGCRLRSELDRSTTEEVAMRLQVKGKNVEVTPSIRAYAERKLGKLEKQLAEQTQVEVELSEQRNPSIAESHVAEGDDLHEGADAACARGVDRHEGVDRPARREARAPGEEVPRAPSSSSLGGTPSTTATSPGPDAATVRLFGRRRPLHRDARRCRRTVARRRLGASARPCRRRRRAGTASSVASRASTAFRAPAGGTPS